MERNTLIKLTQIGKLCEGGGGWLTDTAKLAGVVTMKREQSKYG